MVIEYALQFDFQASNEKIEYDAIIIGLRLTKKLGVKDLKVFFDSQLIVG